MASTATILKFFKRHLFPNLKSYWVETWWETTGWHSFHFDIQDLKRYLLRDHKSDWAETWWEASERHRDSELFKSFRSAIQAALLKVLKSKMAATSNDISSQTVSQIEPKFDGRHGTDTKIQNCVNCSFPISKMTSTAAILKFFKGHLPNRKSDWAETWWKASERQRDSELLKLFRSAIQEGRLGGHLENLETTSAPKPCQSKPKLGVRHWGHMEI